MQFDRVTCVCYIQFDSYLFATCSLIGLHVCYMQFDRVTYVCYMQFDRVTCVCYMQFDRGTCLLHAV